MLIQHVEKIQQGVDRKSIINVNISVNNNNKTENDNYKIIIQYVNFCEIQFTVG